MVEEQKAMSCDAASCLAGIAAGAILGAVFVLLWFSAHRRGRMDALRTMGTDWFDKGNA